MGILPPVHRTLIMHWYRPSQPFPLRTHTWQELRDHGGGGYTFGVEHLSRPYVFANDDDSMPPETVAPGRCCFVDPTATRDAGSEGCSALADASKTITEAHPATARASTEWYFHHDPNGSFPGFLIDAAGYVSSMAEFAHYHAWDWRSLHSTFVKSGAVLQRKTADGVYVLRNKVLRLKRGIPSSDTTTPPAIRMLDNHPVPWWQSLFSSVSTSFSIDRSVSGFLLPLFLSVRGVSC
eukprot:m.612005 g.612005  ORF g.612005 m.612005 type:complete len:237 (+) comp22500_c0_seq59:2553-3263(+)